MFKFLLPFTILFAFNFAKAQTPPIGTDFTFNSPSLNNCSVLGLTAIDFGLTDLEKLANEVSGCFPKIVESYNSQDNYKTYCDCVLNSAKKIGNAQEFNKEQENTIKRGFYKVVGRALANKMLANEVLLRAQHQVDLERSNKSQNFRTCDIFPDQNVLGNVAPDILSKLSCYKDPNKRDEIKKRFDLLFADFIKEEIERRNKTGSNDDPNSKISYCDSPSLSVEEKSNCYMKNLLAIRSKELASNVAESDCFSNVELNNMSSSPTSSEIEDLLSLVLDLNHDGNNNSKIQEYYDRYKKGENVFNEIPVEEIKMISTLGNTILKEVKVKNFISDKQSERLLKLKRIFTKNPKMFHLLSDESTQKDAFGYLLKLGNFKNILREFSLKENKTTEDIETIQMLSKQMYNIQNEYVNNDNFNELITKKINNSCASDSVKIDPGFQDTLSVLLCTAPEDFSLPSRSLLSRMGNELFNNEEVGTALDGGMCFAPSGDTYQGQEKSIKEIIYSIESQTCFSAPYEVSFCRAKKKFDDDQGQGIILDSQGEILDHVNVFSDIQSYFYDDLDKNTGEIKSFVSPLSIKTADYTYLNSSADPSLCYEIKTKGNCDSKDENFKLCRLGFIYQNYNDIIANAPQPVRDIIERDYINANVCLKNTAGKLDEVCVSKIDDNGNVPPEFLLKIDTEGLNIDAYHFSQSGKLTDDLSNGSSIRDSNISNTDSYENRTVAGRGNINVESARTVETLGNDNFYQEKFNQDFQSHANTTLPASISNSEMKNVVAAKSEQIIKNIEDSQQVINKIEEKIKADPSKANDYSRMLENEKSYLAGQKDILAELEKMKQTINSMKDENADLKNKLSDKYNNVVNDPRYMHPDKKYVENTGESNFQPSQHKQMVDKQQTTASIKDALGANSVITNTSSGTLAKNDNNDNNDNKNDAGTGTALSGEMIASVLSLNVQKLDQIVTKPTITVASITEFSDDDLEDIITSELGNVISVFDKSTKFVHLYKLVDGEYVKTHEARMINGSYVYTPIAITPKKLPVRSIASKPEQIKVERSVTREDLLNELK